MGRDAVMAGSVTSDNVLLPVSSSKSIIIIKMKDAKEILEKHCIEFQDEFLTTGKSKRLKEKILNAMEEYKKSKKK